LSLSCLYTEDLQLNLSSSPRSANRSATAQLVRPRSAFFSGRRVRAHLPFGFFRSRRTPTSRLEEAQVHLPRFTLVDSVTRRPGSLPRLFGSRSSGGLSPSFSSSSQPSDSPSAFSSILSGVSSRPSTYHKSALSECREDLSSCEEICSSRRRRFVSTYIERE